MTDNNVTHLPARGRQLTTQSRDLLEPAKPTEIVHQLSACLALVRPVGMGDEAATEWLTVAATTLGALPPDMLAKGAEAARKTCTHHGQIVPKILAETEEWLAMREAAYRPAPVYTQRQIEEARWTPAPGEIEEIKRRVAASLSAA
jgi:hypothetical protein